MMALISGGGRARAGRLLRGLALLTALVGGCTQWTVGGAAAPRIGMNFVGLAYYSTERPFIDRVRSADPWQTEGAKPERTPVDAHGNPLPTIAAGTVISTLVGLDVADPRPQRFVLTYQGSGRFQLAFSRTVRTAPGRIEFEFELKGSQSWMPLRVTVTDPKDPPRNIHIFRADQEALLDKGEVFSPNFLAHARNWSVVRTMDWSRTNASTPVDWATRASRDDATWQRDGVPIEVLVKLANDTDADLWFNIPAQANDAWVRNAVTVIKNSLDPKHRLYLEFSNEVWNFGMNAAHVAQLEGNKLWGKDVNHDGKIDKDDRAENYGPGYVTWYGYRAAQVAAIARSVYTGADAPRLHTVLATQTAWHGLETVIFDGVNRATRGNGAGLFTDYAVTTYFGNDIGTQGTGPDADKVMGWAHGGEAGMAAAFDQLRNGGQLKSDQSLAQIKRDLAYQAKVAADHKLTLVAYEGGAHLTAVQFQDPMRRELVAFSDRLHNDPRMGKIYEDMITAFGAAGGRLLCVYADVGAASTWGYFGILDRVEDKTSVRYEVIKAAAARGKEAAAAAP